jgi:hypothetical protein
MNAIQSAAFDSEMAQAKRLIASRDLEAAFAHLERAHVLGQAYVMPHIRSQWMMCVAEFRRHRPAAMIGQVIRIVLGALGSALGTVPVGNTGGTNISMFKRMPIEAELLEIIQGRVAVKDARAWVG